MKSTTTQAVTNRLENIFSIFVYPKVIRTDNGPPFFSEEFKEYLVEHNIVHNRTTPYYTQSNGVVERFMININKTLRTSLFVNQSWRSKLNPILLNYRAAPHVVTGKAPSIIIFNCVINNKLPSVNINIEKTSIDEEVRNNQQQCYRKAANHFDKVKRTEYHEMKINQHVLIKRTKSNSKLDAKYYKKYI